MSLFFTIIIPVQSINNYIFETCLKLKNLKNQNFEILIFPDEIDENNKDLEHRLSAKIIPSGKVSPAIKRDMAIKYAKGSILAFLDDDAYPNEEYLNVAEKYFLDKENISAIGGPQLTPINNSFWQKVSGAMFLSPLSGSALIRYWPGKKIQEIDDWPSVNLLIRKDDFIKLGGFDSQYWPGEDTKLCLDIITILKKKIIYIPSLIVYHHRRPNLKKHLKQIGNYGLHRGFFAKKLPETSRKIFYFFPSFLVIFIILGIIVSPYNYYLFLLFLIGLAIYILAIIFSSLFIYSRVKNVLISLSTIPYLFLTHIWYGIRFIQGFMFTGKLKSKLGK